MSATITISQKEYRQLAEKAWRYEYLREALENDLFSPPPTRDAKTILEAFKKTKSYTDKFLKGLEKGMARSSYFS